MGAANRTLIKSYLRDAAGGGRTALADQIAYLETQRQALAPQATSGGAFATQISMDGSTSMFIKDVDILENLQAIIAAMEILEAQNGTGDGGSRPTVLGFRIGQFLP